MATNDTAMELCEAGLAANIRMRFTTTHAQVLLKGHVGSGSIRSLRQARCGGLVSFIKRMAMVQDILQKGSSAATHQTELGDVGIAFRMKQIDNNLQCECWR